MQNPFEIAQAQFDEAADLLKLEPNLRVQLREPQRILDFRIPVQMDDGSVKLFQGYRVQFNNALGPYKGGIRFHPQVNLDEVRALAMWMTWKTSAVGLPLGGGKGGVIVDPHALSQTELENLSRGYVRAIWRDLGSAIDVPAPDVYTTAQIMAWMLSEYEKIIGHADPGMITGKPLAQGGSKGRDTATAQGGVFVLEAALAKLGITIQNAKIAIQGFGNAGSVVADLLYKKGAKIVAVADSRGGIYDAGGLNIPALMAHKQATGRVSGFPAECETTSAEVLTSACDILIPASLEGVLTAENAPQVQAKVILELANGPTTTEADELFTKQGVLVIPDVLANAGGVTVSYFEQVQNAQNESWSEESVFEKLQETMQKAFTLGWEAKEKYTTNLRMGVYVGAVARVAEALRKQV